MSMEARFDKPFSQTVDGHALLFATCASCKQPGQASMMQIGHKERWKDYVLGKMQADKLYEISQSQLDTWFNDLNNLHWEHATCNTTHIFEDGNPFEMVDPKDKVKALLRATLIKDFIAENLAKEGDVTKFLEDLTPEDFLRIANQKFEHGADEVKESKFSGMAIAREVKHPDKDDNFDLKALKRSQMEWFPETGKALFRRWKDNQLVKQGNDVNYYCCMSCNGFNEASGMQRGHIVPWKSYLKNRDVDSLRMAKIAYNDLNNLQFECSTCNGSHDWETFTDDEQNTIDNAMMSLGTEVENYDPAKARELIKGVLGGNWKIIPPEFFKQSGISDLAKSRMHDWETPPSDKTLDVLKDDPGSKPLCAAVDNARKDPSREVFRYLNNLNLIVLCELALGSDDDLPEDVSKSDLAELRDCLNDPDAFVQKKTDVTIGKKTYPVGLVLANYAKSVDFDDSVLDEYFEARGNLEDKSRAIQRIIEQLNEIYNDKADTPQRDAFDMIWKRIENVRKEGKVTTFDAKYFQQQATAIKVIRRVYVMWRDERDEEQIDDPNALDNKETATRNLRLKRMERNEKSFKKLTQQDKSISEIRDVIQKAVDAEDIEDDQSVSLSQYSEEDEIDLFDQHDVDDDDDDDAGIGNEPVTQPSALSANVRKAPMFATDTRPAKSRKSDLTSSAAHNLDDDDDEEEDDDDMQLDGPVIKKHKDDRDPPPSGGASGLGGGSSGTFGSGTHFSSSTASGGQHGGTFQSSSSNFGGKVHKRSVDEDIMSDSLKNPDKLRRSKGDKTVQKAKITWMSDFLAMDE
ncbi:hypothetical protein [Sedimentitalea todarodis]|uniref:HNH domain-containing protein n=1 Tax=Sedimentitalea todarodis TaxID=1631240 RepID=A0ABU3VE74_9RHOB|nr:hypothetical protein [Sedimentitalea todarodis]MDU9004489.1 hypothetical protein [Sedimentitalea todarodis]